MDFRTPGDAGLPTVAVLGMGRMGSRLAAILLRHGFDTTVWNRSPGRTDRLAASGAVVESSAARAARHADVVLLVMSDGEAVRQVLFDSDEPVVEQLRDEATVVDVSTTGPRAARAIAAELDRRGRRFVEAPVLGSLRSATDGTLTTLTGGDAEDVERVLRVVESWSAPGRVVYMGEVGTANAGAIAVNTGVGIAAEGLGEALRLGQDLGVNRTRLIAALGGGPFGALVNAKEDMLLSRDSGGTQLSVELLLKDLALALYESSSALPATEAAYLQARLAIAAGRAGADYVEVALRRETSDDQASAASSQPLT